MDRVNAVFTCEVCGVDQVIPNLVLYNGLVEKINIQKMQLKNMQLGMDRRNKLIQDLKDDVWGWEQMQKLREDLNYERTRRSRVEKRVAQRTLVCCMWRTDSLWAQGYMESKRGMV